VTWHEVRVQEVVQQVREAIDPSGLDHPLVEHYSIPSLEATGQPDLVPPDEILSDKQTLQGGEVMLSRLNPRKARVLRVPSSLAFPTVASGEFVIMNATDIDGDYLVYVLLSEEIRQHLHSCVQSVTRSHQRIRPEHLLKMPLRIPERDTQVTIVAYLDFETAKIDDLIAKKQQLLERLAEFRTALITQAVTKGLPPEAAQQAGLDPAPPLKESGVEWIGDVPEHWAVQPFRWVLRESLKYGANEAADLDDPGLPRFIRITDIDNTGHLRDETFRSLPVDVAAPYLLQAGDLLFARSGSVGRTFLYDKSWGPCAYAGYLIRARLDPALALPEFISYFSASHSYASWLRTEAIQSTIENVNAERYSRMPIPLPPVGEQQAIISFLDRQAGRIDALAGRVEAAIERLQEYRTALITAAVTGKIDVRDHEQVKAGASV